MNKTISKIVGICLLPFLVFFVFFFLADGFGFHTLPIILSQSMIPTALGLSMACVMPSGLMDFSPGARTVFAAVIGGLAGGYFGIIGFIIGCFVGGMAGAYLLAFLYQRLRIPSMVVSLGIVLALEALTDRICVATTGFSRVDISSSIANIGIYPKNVVIVLIACLLFYYIFYKTKQGCLLNAVGNDEAMLKNMGVNVDKVKFNAIVSSGLFIFFGAVLQICYSGRIAAIVNMGTMTMVFKPMIGVLIAMELVKIIDNMPLMIFIGEVTIQTVFNGFIALGLTDNIQNIVLGVFLLVVLGVSANRERFAEWRRKRTVRKEAVSI